MKVLVCASMRKEKFELIIVGKNENPSGWKQIISFVDNWLAHPATLSFSNKLVQPTQHRFLKQWMEE